MDFSIIFRKTAASFLIFAMVVTMSDPPAMAQSLPAGQASVWNLPAVGTMLVPSTGYTPAIMAGMTLYPDNPLLFDFIIDTGDDNLTGAALETESRRLINYFLASLTVPEDEMWVNLSPYEKDRIVADGLGVTEMGRDMLAQDYLLKQLTASLMYPEEEIGESFWDRVAAKTRARFGTADVPTNMFNKVWIVPDKAVVYVNGTNVFVSESHLKVMLEEDYLAMDANAGSDRHGLGSMTRDQIDQLSAETKEAIRDIIIPEIEKEVNTGKTFANLRQIFNSMILATWYKKNLKQSVLGAVYVDRNKTGGIELEDKQVKERIYQQYVSAFEKGVYDYVKETYDPVARQIVPRKYFSGGVVGASQAMLVEEKRVNAVPASVSKRQAERYREGHPYRRVRTGVVGDNPAGTGLDGSSDSATLAASIGDLNEREKTELYAIKNRSLTSMGMRPIDTGAFKRVGVITVGDFLDLTDGEFVSVEGNGPKKLAAADQLLADFAANKEENLRPFLVRKHRLTGVRAQLRDLFFARQKNRYFYLEVIKKMKIDIELISADLDDLTEREKDFIKKHRISYISSENKQRLAIILIAHDLISYVKGSSSFLESDREFLDLFQQWNELVQSGATDAAMTAGLTRKSYQYDSGTTKAQVQVHVMDPKKLDLQIGFEPDTRERVVNNQLRPVSVADTRDLGRPLMTVVQQLENQDDIVLAFNGVQGNFWQRSSAVIVDGRLIAKPGNVLALDEEQPAPLNGRFWALSFDQDLQGLFEIRITDGQLPEEFSVQNALLGPPLIQYGNSMLDQLKFGQKPEVEGNHLNWPRDQRMAMSAIGYNLEGKLVRVSLIGNSNIPLEQDPTIDDMFAVLEQNYVTDAILLGTSMDVQTYDPSDRDHPLVVAAGRPGSVTAQLFPLDDGGRPLGSHVTVRKKDAAMTPGGIDFNADMLDLAEPDGSLNFTMDSAMLNNLDSDAVRTVVPVIISITPVMNYLPLLGLAPEADDPLGNDEPGRYTHQPGILINGPKRAS